jgi:O-acetylhomoserine/O-acetylserine sulfhydrylase-like pyridoxal-dependent enzyme
VKSGGRQISSQDIYGATQALFRDVMTPLGVETRCADGSNLAAFERAVTEARPRGVKTVALRMPRQPLSIR